MTPERWQHIARIYELAVDVPPDSRAAFLSNACADDEGLRREVESLLRQDEAVLFLDRSVWATAAPLLEDVPDLAPGDVLGPYRIDGPLGAGGMGEVFRATDTRLDRIVAIKVLPANLAFDDQKRARFAREAKAVAALAHPHICTLYDVGRHDRIDYIVMEYLEGDTVAARLANGPLPLDVALTHTIEIASALDHAHRHGIIHRDLKPANIMLTVGGAKLLDFGLAKFKPAASAPGDADMTVDGTIAGTVRYMSPEQIQSQEIDTRSDLFSLGSVLYEMLTGQRAFDGASVPVVAAALIDREPPPVPLLQSQPALDHIVRRCLAKNPSERWQTATDVLQELKWVAQIVQRSRESTQAAAHPSRPTPGLSGPLRTGQAIRHPVRRFVPWLAALVAAVLLGVWVGTKTARTSVELPLTFFIDAPEGAVSDLTTMMPYPALSPDGRRLAFVARLQSQLSVWVQTLGSPDARLLAGTGRQPGRPFWSPDGRFVAFASGGRLKRISTAGGGAPQDVTIIDGQFAGGVWGRNGTIVFSESGGLSRVSAVGSEKTRVTRVDEMRGEAAHRFPVMLPDGERFVYLVLGMREEDQGLYLGSLRDPTLKQRVVATDANGAFGIGPDGRDYLFFVRDSTLLAQPFDSLRGELNGDPLAVARPLEPGEGGRLAPFTVSGRTLVYRPRFRPKTRLSWLDRRGIPDGTLGAVGAYYRSPSLSPEETKVAVSLLDERTGVEDIWWFDLTRGVSERLTTERIAARYPAWFPDGSGVVFLARRAANLWSLIAKPIPAGGDERPLLTGEPALMRVRDLTRDGRFLLFEKNLDLWALPLDRGREAYPLIATASTENHGRVSPNGRWLAFTSNVTGESQVYVTSFPVPGEHLRVSRNGGSDPQWREDGRELYYVSTDQTFMAVPVQAESTFSSSAPEPLFRTSFEPFSLQFGSSYAPARDGKRFLVVEVVDVDEPRLTAAINWAVE